MKKLLLTIVIIVVLVAVASIYIFIPGKIALNGSTIIATTSPGFDTCLHKPGKWQQWWPDSSADMEADSSFSYNGYSYKLSAPFADGGTVRVTGNRSSADMAIKTATAGRDSTMVYWEAVVPTGNNPFLRVWRYLHAEKSGKNMQAVFDALCNYAGKTENIYGFPITRMTFKEVMLLAYRFQGRTYPGTETVYAAIQKLRAYITSHGAVEKYYPMMNTKQIDSFQYETMIAISIDKEISPTGEFFISRMMPMEDRFLETEVSGGAVAIEKAYTAMEKYMRDHLLTAPARPFEVLITDRSKEPDTTKWLTRIIYPSM